MMKKSRKISEAEWEVMSFIWAQSPVSVRQIVQALSARKNWHARTIRTLLSRLVAKGVLDINAEKNRYLYRPRISQEACVRKESQSFLERVFGGEPASMLIHLVKQSRLSGAEIKQLRQIL